MKRWTPWVAAAIVLALLGHGAWRAVSARKAQQQAQAALSQERALTPIVLQKSELLTLEVRAIEANLPVSGVLRALHSASIKARVPGELQGLALREGDSVRAGQEVARIDATESAARLRQAQQQAEAAQAQVEIARRQLDNNRALVSQGFISSTALQTTEANWQAAQANWQAANAAADVARKALQDTVLRSPISGQVAQRLAQNGERLGVDAKVLEVVDLSRLELEALIAPADTPLLRLGQQAQLQLEGSTHLVSATLVRINPSAQAGSRALPVYLAIDAAQAGAARALLRQGLYVQGLLATGSTQALALPVAAVRNDKPQPYVQTVENGKVAHRTVQLGARSQIDGAPWASVAEGLQPGAQVLLGGVGLLREGTPVQAATDDGAPAQK